MHRAPIDIALQQVTETQQLVEALITSSESFDYVKAKQALKVLQKKARELSKLRAELTRESTGQLPANVISLSALTLSKQELGGSR
jgi:ribosomal protein L17